MEYSPLENKRSGEHELEAGDPSGADLDYRAAEALAVHKKRTKILIGLAALVIIAVVITLPLAIIAQWPSSSHSNNRVFGFEDIFSVNAVVPNVQFNAAGDVYTMDAASGNIYSVSTNGKRTLVAELDASFTDFSVSDDSKFFLLARNTSAVFRHSSNSKYYLYEVASKALTKVFADDLIDESLAVFTPGTQPAQQVRFAIVKSGEIFSCAYTSGAAAVVSTRVTNSALDFRVRNGISDWLYEEEVLASQVSMWFSLSGSKLVYLEYNDTLIQDFQYPFYAPADPMPEISHIAYPTPGYTNPTVKAFVVDLSANPPFAPVQVYSNEQDDTIIFGASWVDDATFALRIMNRIQTYTDVRLFGIDGSAKGLASPAETIPDGWVIPRTAPVFLDANTYVDIRWTNDSYQHVALVGVNGINRFLTSGAYNVYEILCVDSVSGSVVFRAPGPTGAAWDSHIWSVNAKAASPVLVQLDKSGYSYATATFGTSCGSYLLAEQSVSQVPVYTFVSATANPFVVESNSAFQAALAPLNLPTREYMQIAGFNAYLTYPPNFDPKNKKYALIMHPYGGPGSMMALSKHILSDAWEAYFVSNHDAVIAVVDGYGTGAQTREFLYKVYKQLGIFEAQSQATAAWALSEKYPWVDSSRIGFFGWSFGGTQALNAASYNVFDAANRSPYRASFAVAPVTDWRYYDTAYTERYMQTPAMNPDGYAATSCMQRAGAISASLSIMHGSWDDNVHILNSMNYMNAVIKAHRTDVDFYVVPNRQHSIGDQDARRIVWTRVTNHFVNALDM
eukprot:ANDGO_06229.mRNA.1 Putative dipeptidyl aminopeptidase C2E11.08